MTTEERLETLEKELARAKRCYRYLLAGVGLAVMALGFGWIWAKTSASADAQNTDGVKKVILANEIIVEDPNSGERIVLGNASIPSFGNSGWGLTIFDRHSEPRANLQLDFVNRPLLRLYNEEGKDVVTLCTAYCGGWLKIQDPNTRTQASMSVLHNEALLGTGRGHGPGQTRIQLMATEKTTGLNLYDTDGIRFELGAGPKGTALNLYDPNGSPCIGLGVDPEGTRLALGGRQGSCARVSLDVETDRAGLRLFDENGAPRAGLLMYGYGPGLTLWDGNENLRAALKLDEDGPDLDLSGEKGGGCLLGVYENVPKLSLCDMNGKPRLGLGVFETGPSIDLPDENGTIRATLGALVTTRPDGTETKHPESSLWLFGPDGKTLWSAP